MKMIGERYFRSFDSINSLRCTILDVGGGLKVLFFANEKSLCYLSTLSSTSTFQIRPNEVELLHDVAKLSLPLLTIAVPICSSLSQERIIGIYSFESLLFVATAEVNGNFPSSFYLSMYSVTLTPGSKPLHLNKKDSVYLDYQPVDLIVIQIPMGPSAASTKDANHFLGDSFNLDPFAGEVRNFVVVSSLETPFLFLYELDLQACKLGTRNKYFDYYVELIREALQCDLTSSTPSRLGFKKACKDIPSTIMAGFKNGSFNWAYLCDISNLPTNISRNKADSFVNNSSHAEFSVKFAPALSLQSIVEEDETSLSDGSTLLEDRFFEKRCNGNIEEKLFAGFSTGHYFRLLIQSSCYRSLLLDGPVTAIATYFLYTHDAVKMNCGFDFLAEQWDSSTVIGLQCGTVALLAPRGNQFKLLQIPSSFGSAQSIAVGNVSKNCTNDVIVGFEDGTLIVYTIDISCIDVTDGTTATSYLVVNELWRSKFPFSIQCIHFGQLIYDTEYNLSDQVAVLTSSSVHIFVVDDL